MSTPVRFRLRQGERNVEDSLAQRWHAVIDTALGHIRDICLRYTSHLIVIAIAVFVFSAGPVNIQLEYSLPRFATPTAVPALGFRMPQGTLSGRGGEREFDEEPLTTPQPAALLAAARPRMLMASDLYQSPVFHTTIPKRLRREVITYIVERGDNVGKIALHFDLDPETVMWANGNLAQNPDLLRPGQELIILPINGVYHTVVKGDTLLKIAEKYKAEVENIIACPYNQIDPENPQIAPGDKLIVPGGIMPYKPYYVTAYNGPIPTDAQKGSGIFGWPTTGRRTDRFGFRTYNGRWHNGLDISNAQGTSVYVADSGFVIFSGWQNNGFGNIVIVDHQNGFVTYYAHLSSCYVSAGQSVSKGMLIGAMGSTGNSTGSHLHFEVRYKGVRKDPELYLPTQ